ncbi:MAG: hypothetical protein AB8I08_03675 [Sandaracinaceae bacterium]
MGRAVGALLVMLLLACSTNAEPPPEPEVPRRFLRIGGIRANLPSAWDPVPARGLERLQAAARASDPDGRMEMVAVGIDGPSPDFSLTILDLSPSRSEGLSADHAVRAMETDLQRASAARGLTVEFESTCEARHCDTQYTVSGNGSSQQNRVRVWRLGGQIQQRRCACVDDACSEIDRCELPTPPAAASPVGAS